MKEILIINLTRMGDILQSTPLIEGLQERHPGVRITLLVQTAFAEICKGIPCIDELITFDMHEFRKRMTGGQFSLAANYIYLDQFFAQFRDKHFALIINLTHSPVSAIMTSLISADEIRGFTIDAEGNRLIRHPWMRYFFNVVPNRDYNPFHIVDMYLKIGGTAAKSRSLIFHPSEEQEERVTAMLGDAGVADGDRLIGMQLGASKNDRRWPVEKFARLADMITGTYGVRIVLFGSASEADLAEKFLSSVKTAPVNMTGRTTLGELGACIKRCALLIGNDTGTLHIATAVGTRVIGIFSVNAHYMETGPYGEGHYVIEAELPCLPCGFDTDCREKVCKEVILPESVIEVVREILEGTPVSCEDAVWKDVQVYKSYFDNEGVLDYRPLIRRPLKKDILYRILYRYVWNREFNELNGSAEVVSQDIRTYLEAAYSYDELRQKSADFEADIQYMHRLLEVSESNLKLLDVIADEARKKRLDVKKIRGLWEKIEPSEADIEIMGQTYPFLRPIVIIFQYSREALEGSNIKELADASCWIYRDLIQSASKLLQLAEKTLEFIKNKSEINSADDHPLNEGEQGSTSAATTGEPWYL